MFSRLVRSHHRFFSTVQVTTSLVKELRQITGAPILDCKKALKNEETNGDLNLAVEWLRKKGVAVAAKKQSRTAEEGMIGLFDNGSAISMVEVRSETDFVARNNNFLDFVQITLNTITDQKSVDIPTLLSSTSEGKTLNDTLIDLISKMNEKVEVKTAYYVDTTAPNEISFSYLHSPISKYCGTRAALVTLSIPNYESLSVEKQSEIGTIGSDIALQVVGGSCLFVKNLSSEFKQSEYDIEKSALIESVGESSLDEKMLKKLDKKVEKKMTQLTNEVVLMNQKMITGSGTVKQTIKSLSSKLKSEVNITRVVRFEVNGDNQEIP